MKRFIGILQFMTTIPLPFNTGIDEEFHKGAIYFPVVGLILGLIYYFSSYFLQMILPPLPLSLFIVLLQVIMTGGLHIDGVGDTFDGLYSNRNPERILEIMKDSRLGTNGLISIFFLLSFKIVFVYYLSINSILFYLILMPVFGRFAQVFASHISKGARKNGMGNIFLGKISPLRFITTLLITLVIIFGVFFFHNNALLPSLIFIPVVLFFVVMYKIHVYKKIGGLTGDVLGAISELSETLFLAYILIFTHYNISLTLKL